METAGTLPVLLVGIPGKKGKESQDNKMDQVVLKNIQSREKFQREGQLVSGWTLEATCLYHRSCDIRQSHIA
jgi:hypothetical protein